jgi:hypothetical protein
MEIQPFFGEEIITASGMEVRVNPDDRTRARAIVASTSAVTEVKDDLTFSAARTAAGQLKAMLDEIAAAKKHAKLPFDAVGAAINNLAKEIAGPVEKEQNRVLALLNGYVTKLEAAKKAKERQEAERQRLAQAEADRKVREAEAERDRAQKALREAQDEVARALLQGEAAKRENQLLQQQLARELARDVEELGQPAEAPRGLVPGGRVDHKYDFELVSVQTVCQAGHYRLLRWELDIRACQDNVRSQLESNPEAEPTLPGIKITKRLNVSVKAASRIQ